MPRFSSPSGLLVVATPIVMSLVLAGCSGGSGSAQTSGATGSSTPSSSAADPTASGDAPTSPSASQPTASSDPDTTGDKPTKTEAAKGLATILNTGQSGLGLPAAKIDPLCVCIVDKTYSTLTTKSLQAMASGDTKTSPEKSDEPQIVAALASCGTTLGIGPSTTPTP